MLALRHDGIASGLDAGEILPMTDRLRRRHP
jgi:hypothetical protein